MFYFHVLEAFFKGFQCILSQGIENFHPLGEGVIICYYLQDLPFKHFLGNKASVETRNRAKSPRACPRKRFNNSFVHLYPLFPLFAAGEKR